MKKQIYLTDEQRDLLIDILRYAKQHMDAPGSSLTTPIEKLCKRYCSRRVDEIIALIPGTPQDNAEAK